MGQYQSVFIAECGVYGVSLNSSLNLTKLQVIIVNQAEVQRELEWLKTQKCFKPDGPRPKLIGKLAAITTTPICDNYIKSLQSMYTRIILRLKISVRFSKEMLEIRPQITAMLD